MRNYSAFWSDQRIDDIEAESSYGAQQIAAEQFQKQNPRRKVKRFQVVVVLADVPIDPASL